MSFFTISLLILYGIVIVANMIVAFSWATLLHIFICVCIIMLPAALILFLGRILPKKWFDTKRKIYKTNRFKEWICKITHVKSWKDSIPVGGRVAGFRLNELTNPKDITFLNRFIYESCFAEWLHINCAVWGLASLAIIWFINSLWFLIIALPIAVVFAYQNMVSVIIQWNTRPRMDKLRDMVLKRSEKVEHKEKKSAEVSA